MKKKIFWLGVLAIALVLGMTAVSCSDSGGGSPLEGRWYASETYKSLGKDYYSLLFNSDGTCKIGLMGMMSCTWTSTANTVTIKYSYMEKTYNYTISGKKLTLTMQSEGYDSFSVEGTYIR